jgi:glycosyltransferase involved in cell wall biosynthesis
MEVIVLNDGSTDDTEQSVEPFTDPDHPAYDPRVRLHTHENRGKPATLNRGFRLSEGSYIAIVDADDEVPPAGITARYRTAQQEDADFVIGACEVFRGKESLDVWDTPMTTDPTTLRRGFYLFPRQPFHLNACLMSRSLVERAGDVNEDRTRCQDIDFAMRLLSHARSIATTSHVTYRYRKYRSSLRNRLQLRLKTMLHRMMVMIDNLDGWERIAGPLVGLSYDALKMAYEVLAGAYPKRSA